MHRANHQNTKHESDIFANHAYELARHAQELTFCMAAMSALVALHDQPGTPYTAREMMRPMSEAVYSSQVRQVEMNPLEW